MKASLVAITLFGAACSKDSEPSTSAPPTPVEQLAPVARDVGSAVPAAVQSKVRIDLPDRTGWRALPLDASSSHLLLVSERRQMISAVMLDHEPTRSDRRDQMVGSDDVRISDESPHTVRALTGGDKFRGWMVSLACNDDWVLLYFAEEDDATPPTSAEVVTRVRCVAKDSPDVSWPSTAG